MHKVLIMFYHLTTIKIRIIKKFHKDGQSKLGIETQVFFFFGTEGVHACKITIISHLYLV
jgi:hypothetical protein